MSGKADRPGVGCTDIASADKCGFRRTRARRSRAAFGYVSDPDHGHCFEPAFRDRRGGAWTRRDREGSEAPPGLVFRSWPDAAAFDALGGEPALTLVPNLLLTGVLAVLISVAIGVWTIWGAHHPRWGAGLVTLSMLQLICGGGFGPPAIGLVAGLLATRVGPHLEHAWRPRHGPGCPALAVAVGPGRGQLHDAGPWLSDPVCRERVGQPRAGWPGHHCSLRQHRPRGDLRPCVGSRREAFGTGLNRSRRVSASRDSRTGWRPEKPSANCCA